MSTALLTEKEQAALEVIDLAKSLILADNHYLSAAIGRMKAVSTQLYRPFATTGYELGFDAELLCAQFLSTQKAPKEDLLHTVMHCVFLHPYVGPAIDRPRWNLACDIAVERNIADMCGQRAGSRGTSIAGALAIIQSACGERASAEKIYKALCAGTFALCEDSWTEIFLVDDHIPWYIQPQGVSSDSAAGDGDDEDHQSGGLGTSSSADDSADSKDQCSEKSSAQSSERGNESQARSQESGQGEASSASNSNQEGISGGDPNETDRKQGAGTGSSNKAQFVKEAQHQLKQVAAPDLQAAKDGWQRVARALTINLQTYAKNHGKELSGTVQELEESAHNRMDYGDFLRQFAIPGEVLKVSDDEFDYIFYTYGLSLYGNLPLIEPLEYKEEKRIREFVIVIDTSGSVYGSIVQKFINTTFDILKSTEAFFERIHVRIIQCDASVQSDDVITSLVELKEWGNKFRIHGGGGTDFAPAFAYVDKLVEDGEFENLGGLIYFTDGWGSYPNWTPEYKTAFVFYDNDYRPECVPPWAAQIVMDEDTVSKFSNNR